MNCTRIFQWLPLYASEDLTASQLAQVRTHLAQCESCAAEAAEFAAARAWSQNITVPEFDETFYAELRYAVRQELATQPERAAWWTLWWKPLAVTVALLLLTIVSVHLFQTKGASPTDIVNTPASPQLPDTVRTPIPPINELAQTQKPRVPLRKQGRALPIKQGEKGMFAAATVAVTMKPDVTEKAAEPVMSRIEIQTADPNIRIIWLTQNTQSTTAEPLMR